MKVTPPTDATARQIACDDRSPGGDTFKNDTRFQVLNQLFRDNKDDNKPQPPPPAPQGPFDAAPRFAQIQTYHWTLEAQDNKAVGPPADLLSPAPGQRG